MPVRHFSVLLLYLVPTQDEHQILYSDILIWLVSFQTSELILRHPYLARQLLNWDKLQPNVHCLRQIADVKSQHLICGCLQML